MTENVVEVTLRANTANLLAGYKEAGAATGSAAAQIRSEIGALSDSAGAARAPMTGLTDALKDWRTHVRTEARYTNFLALQVEGLGIASKGAAAEITGLVSGFAFGGGIGVGIELVKMVAHAFHDLTEAAAAAKEEMKKFSDELTTGTDKAKKWAEVTILAMRGASQAQLKAHEEIKPLLEQRQKLEEAIAVMQGNVASAREDEATNEFDAMQKIAPEDEKKLERMREELRILTEQINKRQVAIGGVATEQIGQDKAKDDEDEKKRRLKREQDWKDHLMRLSAAEFTSAKAISKMKDDQLKYQIDRVLEEEKREDNATAEAQKRADERFAALKKQIHDLTGEGTRFGAAFGTSFAGIIAGTMSVSQAFSNMAKAALHVILDQVRKAIEAYALQAAAAAAAANAGIPGFGIFIAAAAAAAMEALVMGLLGSLPSAAVGMPYVPSDMPVMVHKKEAILTEGQADDWRAGRGGGGSGLAIHIHAMDGASVQRVVESDAFRRAIRESRRNGQL